MTVKRPITVEDLIRIITVSDPQISPDGQWIASVHTAPNANEKRYTDYLEQRGVQISAGDIASP